MSQRLPCFNCSLSLKCNKYSNVDNKLWTFGMFLNVIGTNTKGNPKKTFLLRIISIILFLENITSPNLSTIKDTCYQGHQHIMIIKKKYVNDMIIKMY